MTKRPSVYEDEADRCLYETVNRKPPEPVSPAVKILPVRMLQDLRLTGGANLETIKRDLDSELQQDHNRRSSELKMQTETAQLIRSALGQAKDSPAYTLALQMLDDFSKQAGPGGDT